MACKTSQRFIGYPAFLKVPLKRHIVKCYCAIRMLEEILNILLKYHNPYKDSKLDKIYKLIIDRSLKIQCDPSIRISRNILKQG